MEQTLISKKNLAEVYKKWIQDCVSEDMKTECGVIEDCLCELYAQEVIDPLHALGACYCMECLHHNKSSCPAYDAPFNRTSLRIEYCNCGERKQNEILD